MRKATDGFLNSFGSLSGGRWAGGGGREVGGGLGGSGEGGSREQGEGVGGGGRGGRWAGAKGVGDEIFHHETFFL